LTKFCKRGLYRICSFCS